MSLIRSKMANENSLFAFFAAIFHSIDVVFVACLIKHLLHHYFPRFSNVTDITEEELLKMLQTNKLQLTFTTLIDSLPHVLRYWWGIDSFFSPFMSISRAYMYTPRSNYPGRQGGQSLIWLIRVRTAEQGMVFNVLSLKQGIQFHYWESWTGCLFGLEAFQRVWRLAMSGLHLQYR